MVRTEIRIAGTGGMGVVLAGVIMGRAAVLYGGLDAVQTQSYGSEARGTAAKSEVIISDERIRYPKVRKSDYFVAMSQKALEMYGDGVREGSVIIIDEDLVDPAGYERNYEILKVPSMRTADELGRRMVSNMIMLGALVKKSGIFPLDALIRAVSDIVPPKTIELNTQAINAGATSI